MNANSLLALKVGFDILMLGEHHLGKSLVVLRYVHQRFIDNIDSLVEDMYVKVIADDDSYQEFLIFDALALQDRYSLLRKQQFLNCHCLMVVYSITDRDLFEPVEDIVQHFNMVRNKAELTAVPMVLVGNKADLDDIRQVSDTEGQELALRLGMSFFEVLAATGEGVNEAFAPLIEILGKTRERRPSAKAVSPTSDRPSTAGTLQIDRDLGTSSPESSLNRRSQSATSAIASRQRSSDNAVRSASKKAAPEAQGCCVIT